MRRRIGSRLAQGAWPALAAFVALIPYAGGLSTTKVFHIRDLGMYFWPRHLWQWRAWRSGDWPLWDPYAGGGQSAVADALNQFFLLPITLVRILTPPVVGFNLWIAAPFPILAMGAWLWLGRRASPPAAFVGASFMALAGPVLSTGNFPNFSWAVAFIPWILWAVDRVCEAPRFPRLAALALCVGFQAVAGEPVTFSASCVLILAYAASAVPADNWSERRTRLLRVGAALTVGVLLSAVQMVPLLHAVSRSPRAVDIDESFWSLHPLAVLDTVIPHLFGHVYYAELAELPWVKALNSGREPLFYSLYMGVGAGALALVGAPAAAHRRWRLFWWAVWGLALLSALGHYTPFYPTLQRLVPVLETFRFPVKYLVFAVVAQAALAASGADALLLHSRTGASMRRPRATYVFLGSAAAFAATLGLAGVFRVNWMASLGIALGRLVEIEDTAAGAEWLMQAAAPLWLRLAVLATLLSFLVALVWRRHRLAPVAAWTLCAVAVLDPVAVNYDIHPTLPAARLGPPVWADVTGANPLDRVYVGGRVRKGTSGTERLHVPNRYPVPLEWGLQEAVTRVAIEFSQTPAAWGVRELISYDLPQLWPREYVTMLRAFRDTSPEGRLRFLRRTGTRYCFQSEAPYPGAPLLVAPAITAPVALYQCHDDPRRLYITAGARVEPDLRRQIELMFDEKHDPFTTVLLDREPPAPAGLAATGATTSEVQVVRERHMELIVRADVGPSGGYLNVVDSHDPFWVVEVDGERAELLRANGLFRAVRLAPGAHDVRFAYRPTPFYVGLAISCASALLLLAGCIWTARAPATATRPRASEAAAV